MIRVSASRRGFEVMIGDIELDITTYEMVLLVGAFAHQYGVIDTSTEPTQCGTRIRLIGGSYIIMQSYPRIPYITCIYQYYKNNRPTPEIRSAVMLADDISDFWKIIYQALEKGAPA